MSRFCLVLAALLVAPVTARAGGPLQALMTALTAPVVINGTQQQMPGVPGGNYWYDATSGLWGLVGGPAMGYVAPGLDLGPLDPNASGGGTGVLLNGRVLPPYDLMLLTSVYGLLPEGRYWLDARGNIGRDGQRAFGNLRGQAAQPAQAAGGQTPASEHYGFNLDGNVQYDLDIGSGQWMDMNSGDIYSR